MVKWVVVETTNIARVTIDLKKIRTKFYQIAQWQLERGGYMYQVDKTDFEALTITRGLNVMQPEPDTRSSDDEIIISLIIDPVAKACHYILTASNCLELSSRTA